MIAPGPLDQLLIKLIAVDGTPLPVRSYLNFLTTGSGPPVDNPNFTVNGEVVGSTDVPPQGGGSGGSAGPIDVAVTTAGGVSSASMPIGRAWKILAAITTQYAGAGAVTASVSVGGTVIKSGIDLTQPAGVYPFDVLVNVGTSGPVVVTVTGSPGSGAAEFLVFGGAVQT